MAGSCRIWARSFGGIGRHAHRFWCSRCHAIRFSSDAPLPTACALCHSAFIAISARSYRLLLITPAEEHAPASEGGEHLVESHVALVQARFHAGLEHAVALLGRVEEALGGGPRATVAKVLEARVVDRDVPRHAVPFERLDEATRRRDLAKATLETLGALRGVLDKAPMPATLDLHALDVELVPAPPPLGDELRICEGPPDALARGVEDALDVNFAVRRDHDGCGV